MTTRYERNIAIRDIGETGQAALKGARVGVLGAGGLGSPVLYYLAAAGFGFIRVADFDVVMESNLQRQVLHSTARLGENKAESAAKTLRALNPEIEIDPIKEVVTGENVARIFADVDVVVEASDNFEAKFLLGDYCADSGQPLVWGTAVGLNAMVTTFASRPLTPSGPTATLRELYPQIPPVDVTPTAATAGILGATVGVAGSLMAMEVIRIVTGMPNALVRRLALIDMREPGMRVTTF
ncbi:MAG: HesA/MoeB/ThiF family protein [Actinomycetaceae bacterium]|nr:HesA/MoeB/ThiF family protein [Actinomycetaceae bacterium]